MKYVVFISVLINCYFSFCQESDSIQIDYKNERSFSKGWTSSNTVLSWEYVFIKYQIQGLNEEVEASLGTNFSDYLGGFGSSFSSSLLVNRKFTMDAHLDYSYYFSSPTVIELNDSSRFHIKGFHIGIDGCKDLFPKYQNIDFLFGLGFNAGRLVFGNWDLTNDNKTNRKNKYTNPFFTPKLVIEPRFFLFKHISISFRGELVIDITNYNWKAKSNTLNPIARTAATGYNIGFTLGWRD